MAYPIPTDERTFHPKRFRGARRDVHPEKAEPYLHHDSQVRRAHQVIFEENPVHVIIRGLSQAPPSCTDYRATLRHIDPPSPMPHPERRRNPHKIPPLDEGFQREIFPNGGMSVRPAVAQAARVMEARDDSHFILAHVSPQDGKHDGRRVFPNAYGRSTRGDMSLMHTGVKRVEQEASNPDPNSIPGFREMGRYSEPADKPSGKKSVTPQPWDPIRYFDTYGRRHPLVLQSTTR